MITIFLKKMPPCRENQEIQVVGTSSHHFLGTFGSFGHLTGAWKKQMKHPVGFTEKKEFLIILFLKMTDSFSDLGAKNSYSSNFFALV